MSVTDARDQIDVEPPRAPVCNHGAEQALLGALLLDNKTLGQVADIVAPADFAWGVHGRIFAAITALIRARKSATPVTMHHLFANDPALRKVGGGKYLMTLARHAVTTHNAPDYAIIIADCALRRELIAKLEEPSAGQTAVDVIRAARPRLEAQAKAEAGLRRDA